MTTKLIPPSPVRRARSGRPGSAGEEIPLTASMERLPPDPSTSVRSSYDVQDSWSPRARTPKGAAPPSTGRARTNSAEGPRRASVTEAIALPSPVQLKGQRSASDGVAHAAAAAAAAASAIASGTSRPTSAASMSSSINPVQSVELSGGWPAPAAAAAATAAAAASTNNGSSLVTGRHSPADEQPVSVSPTLQRSTGAATAGGTGSKRYVDVSASLSLPDPSTSSTPRRHATPSSVNTSYNGALRASVGGPLDDGALPATPGSVASGYDDVGDGTFFTAVRRSFADGFEDVSASTQLNPMQSPDASQHGGEAAGQDEDSKDEDWFINPMMTPTDASVASMEGPSLAEFLLEVHRAAAAAEPPPDSRPATAASCSVEEPAVAFTTAPVEDDAAIVAASRQAVSARTSGDLLQEQEQRRAELANYMAELKDKTDDDGAKLVRLPKEFLTMVHKLMLKNRQDHDSLKGWEGPHRFEDLPHQLPALRDKAQKEADAKLARGLQKILANDERLRAAVMEGRMELMMWYPEAYEEQERLRLERHTKRVEEALKLEEERMQKVYHLERVLEATGSDSDASSAPGWFPRYFTLKPAEEELVQQVLRRKDDAEVNPFKLGFDATVNVPRPAVMVDGELVVVADLATIDGNKRDAGAASSSAGADRGGVEASLSDFLSADGDDLQASVAKLDRINARLEAYAAEHVWDEAGQLADFRLAALVPPSPSAASSKQRAGDDDTFSDAGSISRGLGGSVADGRAAGANAPHSPTGSSSSHSVVSHSRRSVAMSASGVTETGKVDYLRPAREAKELAEAEKDVDLRLRQLKTGEPPPRLTPDQLQQLIAHCRRVQETGKARAEADANPPSDAPAAGASPNLSSAPRPTSSGSTHSGGDAQVHTRSSATKASTASASTPSGSKHGIKTGEREQNGKGVSNSGAAAPLRVRTSTSSLAASREGGLPGAGGKPPLPGANSKPSTPMAAASPAAAGSGKPRSASTAGVASGGTLASTTAPCDSVAV